MTAGLVLVSLLDAARAAPPTLDDVRSMRTVVEERGLVGFRVAVTTKSWEAPVMPSAWYVVTVAPAGERPYHVAARELGSTLLAAIDAWAPLMRSDSSDDVLVKATHLIDLAHWLGRAEGYANLVLTRRARDVAITGLARRVADLSAPLPATMAQLARCRAPFDAPVVRARVLNAESGGTPFPVDPTVTDQVLMNVWSRRQLGRLVPELDAMATASGDPDHEIADLKRMMRELGVTPAPPDSLDPFFVDDEQGEEPTTRRLWSKKFHQELLGDPAPQNLESVETLVQFRRVVGAFPTQPAVRGESISTPGEEAFADAWRPHIGDATFNLGRGAWSVYARITRSEFLDYDSASSLSAAARRSLLAPKP